MRLHASDPRRHALRRSVKQPGRAVLVSKRPAPPRTLPAPRLSPGGSAVFPVAGAFDFGGPDARFGAGRTGHVHEGRDIMAASGTPVLAPYAGMIGAASYQASGAGE